MTLSGGIGRFRLALAVKDAELHAAQRLRQQSFLPHLSGDDLALVDADAFDARFDHLLIRDSDSQDLVATCRLTLYSPEELATSYSAQFYDLSLLSMFAGPFLEIGRFCVDQKAKDPDVLRLMWAGITALVLRERVSFLFGCSSFSGTELTRHRDGLALLARRHLAPEHLHIGLRAPETIPLSSSMGDYAKGVPQLPALLRSYLSLGGWVSDHAVIDRDLQTVHVFTGVEVARVPPRRAESLRAIAKDAAICWS